MNQTRDDAELLELFVREGSEPAFRELVERHIAMVNATAQRLAAGDAHLAQDVTQLVFTDLARKARALPAGTVLGGWLYRHTCFTTAKAIRGEGRRRARERTAMELSAMNADSTPETHWQQLAPVLDEALDHLGEEDRDAVVLRFFQQRDLRSIGHSLRVSEDAAQKRVARALEKLRGFLERRGVTLSTALLATTLDAGAKTTVPAGLAASVSTSALHTAATKTAFTLTSLKSMITTKIVVGAAAAVALASVATFAINREPAPVPMAATTTPTVAPTPADTPKVAAAPAPAVSQPPARVQLPVIPPQTGTGPATSVAANEPVEPPPSNTFVKVGGGTLTLTGERINTGTFSYNVEPHAYPELPNATLIINTEAYSSDDGTVILTNGDTQVIQVQAKQ